MSAEPMTRYRLDGLEPDNLLGFLSLLGLLRALEAVDRSNAEAGLWPRAAWDLDGPPLRPVLILAREKTPSEVALAAAQGLDILAAAHDFGGKKDVSYDRRECRDVLEREAGAATVRNRTRVDVFAALMTDAVIKEQKGEQVQPTPLCLLFGQGHQHFLERLAGVPGQPAPPDRGRGKKRREVTPSECLEEALFHPWHRSDPTFSFRWDPEEDVRYALMAGDPTDPAYKLGTQHGANRLAAVGLACLPVVPSRKAGRPRVAIPGVESNGGLSFAWPVWRDPTTLASLRALISHPRLREPGALRHLGVDHVFVTRRISVGRYMNFTRARLLEPAPGLGRPVTRAGTGQGRRTSRSPSPR